MATTALAPSTSGDFDLDLIPTVGGWLPPTYDPSFHDARDSSGSGSLWVHRMPHRYLGQTGMPFSLLSYGGSSLGNYYSDNASRSESLETIQLCLKSGINYLETGPWYGPSEEIIGQALEGVPRSTFYLSTKAGRYFTPDWEDRFDFRGQSVLKSVEESLSRLKLSYVDLIQIHDVEFCLDPQVLLTETLPALDSVVRAGKAKFIGITGYCLETMLDLVRKSPVKIHSILNYARYNFHDLSLDRMVPSFDSEGVGVINASPVAMGLFTSKGPPDWHAASGKVRELARVCKGIAEKKGTSIEKAALGFSLRPNNRKVASTLVSIPNKEILTENLEIVTGRRTEEEEELYEELFEVFEKGLGEHEKGDWAGVELAEYKKFVAKKKVNEFLHLSKLK